jgi:hypothetical protein
MPMAGGRCNAPTAWLALPMTALAYTRTLTVALDGCTAVRPHLHLHQFRRLRPHQRPWPQPAA